MSDKDAAAKAASDEALTLEELHELNVPAPRADNDDLDIGKRYEGTDYAPAAQPDLNAPAYVLVQQAKDAAEASKGKK